MKINLTVKENKFEEIKAWHKKLIKTELNNNEKEIIFELIE